MTKRQYRAMKLRARGLTYDQIGKRLGISDGRAHALVQKGLRNVSPVPMSEVHLDQALWEHGLTTPAKIKQAITSGRIKKLTNFGPARIATLCKRYNVALPQHQKHKLLGLARKQWWGVKNRQRVVRMRNRGMSFRDIGVKLNRSYQTVRAMYRRWKDRLS